MAISTAPCLQARSFEPPSAACLVRLVAGLMTSSAACITGPTGNQDNQGAHREKVGLAGFGDATHVLARLILARNGIDPEKEVQFVPLGTDSARFSALQQKTRRRSATSPPLDFEGKKLGYNVLARAYEHVNYPLSGVGVSIKSIEQNLRSGKTNDQGLIKAESLHQRK